MQKTAEGPPNTVSEFGGRGDSYQPGAETSSGTLGGMDQELDQDFQ